MGIDKRITKITYQEIIPCSFFLQLLSIKMDKVLENISLLKYIDVGLNFMWLWRILQNAHEFTPTQIHGNPFF